MEQMKAVLCPKYGPPEVLQLGEVAKPTPKKNEVCVKIFAAAVTPSDCVLRGAKISMWHPVGFLMRLGMGFLKPRNPLMGMVLAGEVESVGNNVRRFKKGDQVYGMLSLKFGTYAQYKCLSENACLVGKPANINFEEAAAVPWSGLAAWDILKKGKVKNGRKVLVYGAFGLIGSAAVQLAKCMGAEVTGLCRNQDFAFVKSLGADTVMDYTKEDWLITDERYDFILDAVGKTNRPKLNEAYKTLLTEDGKYLSVDNGFPNTKIEYLQRINQFIKEGQLKPAIDRAYPLEQIIEAHQYADDWFQKGNVVITVGHPSPSE